MRLCRQESDGPAVALKRRHQAGRKDGTRIAGLFSFSGACGLRRNLRPFVSKTRRFCAADMTSFKRFEIRAFSGAASDEGRLPDGANSPPRKRFFRRGTALRRMPEGRARSSCRSQGVLQRCRTLLCRGLCRDVPERRPVMEIPDCLPRCCETGSAGRGRRLYHAFLRAVSAAHVPLSFRGTSA